MVAWVIRESGNHAIAGIWHEGTDIAAPGVVSRVEKGRRQYALFAGLAANNGAAAAHVSENGGASFGDKYARNLSVTKELIPAVSGDSTVEVLDRSWSTVAFSFDNRLDTVTAYLDGKATDLWIDNPEKHPFFQWPAKAWKDGGYNPPEGKPLERQVESVSGNQRIELQTFRFTKVRVTYQRSGKGKFVVAKRDLLALRANPFWFAHDLYNPRTPEEGGPFSIGRVIHTSRSVGFTGYIGGVAVFNRSLTAAQMARLATIATVPLVQKTK